MLDEREWDNMFLQEKVKEINEKLNALKDISHVAVWGAGVHTCKLFEKSNLLSYSVKTIIDINKEKRDNIISDLPSKILMK